MHVVTSTVVLSAPENECIITLTISGEKGGLTKIVHEMCSMAINRAIEPLRDPAPEV